MGTRISSKQPSVHLCSWYNGVRIDLEKSFKAVNRFNLKATTISSQYLVLGYALEAMAGLNLMAIFSNVHF